jgi:2-C-methyl-D-erythritol 4-phosphate cytidylyltransferase
VLPVTDTVKLVGPGGHVLSTLDRGGLRRVQTPQGFPLSVIHELHVGADEKALDAPDDAFLCERAGIPVRAVDGEAWNLKVTTSADLAVATWLAESGRAERAGACRPTWNESDL